MKNLMNKNDWIVAVALGLVIGGTAFSSANSKDVKESNVDQYSVVEISEEIVFVEDMTREIRVYNELDQLVYQSESISSDEELQVILRTSDFLLEVDGIKYYRTYEK